MADTFAEMAGTAVTGTSALPSDRVALVREASFELEILLKHLRDNPIGTQIDGHEFLVRGITSRAIDLNGVILSVVDGDDERDTAEMHRLVFGRSPESAESKE
jgi:hypothetical protein